METVTTIYHYHMNGSKLAGPVSYTNSRLGLMQYDPPTNLRGDSDWYLTVWYREKLMNNYVDLAYQLCLEIESILAKVGRHDAMLCLNIIILFIY